MLKRQYYISFGLVLLVVLVVLDLPEPSARRGAKSRRSGGRYPRFPEHPPPPNQRAAQGKPAIAPTTLAGPGSLARELPTAPGAQMAATRTLATQTRPG